MILKISLVITVLIVGRRSTTVSGDGEAEFAGKQLFEWILLVKEFN